MPSTLYTDPRLVALYDTLNPFATDTGFYLTLAAGMQRVIDLGCGTGLLACELASRGHRVIAVDPAPEMLHVARHRPNGDRVQWIEGDARALALLPPADLLVMTGHVAQVFLDDTAFFNTLKAARYALRDGGTLAFEPQPDRAGVGILDARAITQADRRGADRRGGGVAGRCDRQPGVGHSLQHVLSIQGDRRDADVHERTALSHSGRTHRAARAAGFRHLTWQGDWDGQAVSAASRELIVVAR